MTENQTVSWTQEDRVLRLTLNRPPANALGLPLIEGLHLGLDAFDKSDARVLVVDSALDGFFAAGADIKQMSTATNEDFAAYGEALRGPMDRLATHDRPSIAAIEGLALGGGLELALACTLRVGGRNARLGLPESKLGLIPGAGGTQRLPRLVGRGRALDIMLTARDLPAEEAYAIGLLDRLVDPGTAVAEATELAATLCARSGAALTAIMRCVDDAQSLPQAEGLVLEAERENALFAGPEAQEGISAFVQKRRPDYG